MGLSGVTAAYDPFGTEHAGACAFAQTSCEFNASCVCLGERNECEHMCVRGMCMGNNAAIQQDLAFVLSSALQCCEQSHHHAW